MLTLVLGRAHTGKSARLLQQLQQQAQHRAQILIVPEQHSHNAERALASLGGTVSLRAEVLSFTRLCDRVFADAGGLAAPTLDAGGRLLLLHRAMQECSDQLRVLRRTKIGFLETLLKTIDECKSFQIKPMQLYTCAPPESEVGQKFSDLALLLDCYDALLEQTALDPMDKLTQLEEQLQAHQWCKGKDIYIDGFTDFTKQERAVIARFMRQAESVTIALTCDKLEAFTDGIDIFAPARRTALSLCALAEHHGVAREVLIAREQHAPAPFSAHLEQYLFSNQTVQFKGARTPALHVAGSAQTELAWVAAEILRLVREEGYRYRDIAVVARSMDAYQGIAELVFARYGIPLFFSEKEALLQQPVMVLLSSILEATVRNYPYEALFRYLKTGLTPFARDEIDVLENYVLTWDLRGSAWTAQAPWQGHPDGFQAQFDAESEALLARLDALRRAVIAPLERVRKSGARTMQEHACALYDCLVALDLPATLTQRAQDLIAQGALTQAEEMRQIWDILCKGLDQAVAIAGALPADLEDFAQLLTLVYSRYEIGSIPVSLDRVTMLSYDRLGAKRPRAMFLIGADDASIPQVVPSTGILTEDDRRILNEAGIDTSPSSDLRLLREMTMVYEACTAPQEALYCSYVRKGEQHAPSFVFHRIQELFPQAACSDEETMQEEFRLAAPLPALEVAARHPVAAQALAEIPDYAGRLTRMRRAAVLQRGRLSPDVVAQMYQGKARMSASRLDKLKSCHFSDFMQYGLRARERRQARFDAPIYGSFVHFVLERVLTAMEGKQAPSQADMERLIDEAIEAFAQQTFGALQSYSARFRYLFLRQKSTVRAVAMDVLEELRRSQFRPRGFELSFGEGREVSSLRVNGGGISLELGGFVDRVDGYEWDNQLYLRVLDYKTGLKKMDWTTMREGMGLQMLLYLFALEEGGASYFQSAVAPAGVLYVPARDPVIEGEYTMAESKRLKERGKALRRSGLVLDQPEILTAMEQPPEGEEPIFLPANQISRDHFAQLRGHVLRTLEDTAQDLAHGTICADPYYRNEQDQACTYCPYFRACHFEEGKGDDRRRYLKSIKQDEFWAELQQGGGEPDGTI